jgi:hypothetical protein
MLQGVQFHSMLSDIAAFMKLMRARLRQMWNHIAYRIVRSSRPICTSVLEVAGTSQAVVILSEEHTIVYDVPLTVEKTVRAEFYQRQITHLQPRYLTPIHKARLFGTNGLIILPDGQFAAETVYGASEMVRNRDYLKLRLPTPKQMDGGYLSLILGWWDNYFHWLFDVLPRLHHLLEHLPDDIRFIAPAAMRPYQRDSLAAVGISDHQLVLHPASEMWELETLYFSPPMPAGCRSPEAIRWVRRALLEQQAVIPQASGRRLYVSRRFAATRRVKNEAEVEALLHDYGFITVLAETLSFNDQIALFAVAEIVIGAHGAGLANLMFAPEGTKVVEFLPSDDVRGMYWKACHVLKHPYYYVLSEGHGPYSELHVDLHKLEATLALLGLP